MAGGDQHNMTKVRLRLAMRREGSLWNAYLARVGTMEGAMLLGSIRMTLAADEKVKEAFMGVMRLAMTVAALEATGVELAWPEGPQPAPESERGGNA